MNLLRKTSTCCVVCERPAPRGAVSCPYCGENLPGWRTRMWQRAALLPGAMACTAAFVAAHGGVQIPRHITLAGAPLLALGLGLALFPPALEGISGGSRTERLRQILPPYAGGAALALLSALLLWSAGSLRSWTWADVLLGATNTLWLLALPVFLAYPWSKLAAGALLAAGMLLCRP
jgi:hypothetical protein